MRRVAPFLVVLLPLGVALGAQRAFGAPWAARSAVVRPAGSELFLRKGCVACHTLDGDADAVGTMGPDLSGLGQQMSPARLRAYIADPQAFDATTSMPLLDLTSRQVALLAAFILTPPATPTPLPTPAVRPRPSPTGF